MPPSLWPNLLMPPGAMGWVLPQFENVSPLQIFFCSLGTGHRQLFECAHSQAASDDFGHRFARRSRLQSQHTQITLPALSSRFELA